MDFFFRYIQKENLVTEISLETKRSILQIINLLYNLITFIHSPTLEIPQPL